MTILTSNHGTIASESHSTGKLDVWEDMLEGFDWGVHRLLRALQLTPDGHPGKPLFSIRDSILTIVNLLIIITVYVLYYEYTK